MATGFFVVLLVIRESTEYGHRYDFLPILGGSIPFLVLTILLVLIHKLEGGSTAGLGLCWPNINHSAPKAMQWIVFAAVLILVARLSVDTLMGPLLDFLGPGADTLSRLQQLVGNLFLLLFLLPVMWLFVIGEEVLFRGLLMNYLAKKVGGSTQGWVIAIVISAVIFGLFHFWQGPRGMVASGMCALVYGAGYYLSGRNLWPAILAHGAGNTLGFVSIYLSG